MIKWLLNCSKAFDHRIHGERLLRGGEQSPVASGGTSGLGPQWSSLLDEPQAGCGGEGRAFV